MKLIWFNADAQEYKVGLEGDYETDSSKSSNPEAYTVLMEFEESADPLANKIMRQLNRANIQRNMSIAS